MLGLVAGRGRLPVLLAEGVARDHLACRIATLQGIGSDVPMDRVWRSFILESLGSFLQDLRAEGVTDVCFAGAIRRPEVRPDRLDSATRPLVDRIFHALRSGDDGALRTIMAIFEEHGFRVVGAHDLRPDLLAAAGLLAGDPPAQSALDQIPRAVGILRALSGQDVGQSVVVANGQCLGIETIQGTDALLQFVEHSGARPKQRHAGILVKAPKLGQDLRVDMPAIGPATVERVARAGLAGIVVQQHQTLILDRTDMVAEAARHGVFVLAQDLTA
jgi:DUF1009 family protein